ncbi:MAG: O-antigen ligase family protein [Anaerolineales bacterium]|nr:O-antigen ligase family protein [Anaerolineales bacterium]
MKRLLGLLSIAMLIAALAGAGAVTLQHQALQLGVVAGLPPETLAARPTNLRAVNIDLTGYDAAALPGVLDDLAGFGWLRVPVYWARIESAPGRYNWQVADTAVAAAAERGFDLILVLIDAPDWAAPSDVDVHSPVGDVGAFADFAGQVAARYGPQVDAYQVWDEPNIRVGWIYPPSAGEYATLLAAAYPALKAADPSAIVLAAALAPTVETGPDNISDLVFLQQLYDLDADSFFDAAAGKPYGFETGPDDRDADPEVLGVARFTLLRAVMERNGDGAKLLWGGNFGWNVRPDSLWRTVTPDAQIAYTQGLWTRAETEWLWAGPLALEAYQPRLTTPGQIADAADPHWGFALTDPFGAATSLGQALATWIAQDLSVAGPGSHSAQHPAAAYTGPWEFGDLGADIPEDYTQAALTIRFQGSDLGLRVRRGAYRAYLYVEVDGQPANALPRDDRGAYLVLTSPTETTETVLVRVAGDLDPSVEHVAVIRPDRGWDQWAIAGFAVGRPAADDGFALALTGLTLLGAVGLAGLYGTRRELLNLIPRTLSDRAGLALTTLAAGLLYVAGWLAWDAPAAALTRRLGDVAPIVVTAATAGVFYFAPSFTVAVAALLFLGLLFFLRPDLALAMLAAVLPFFLFPRMLWSRGASLYEFALWLAAVAVLLRFGPGWIAQRVRPRLTWLDGAVLALVVVGAASTLAADQRAVALYEYRTVFLASALLYALLRIVPLDRPAQLRVIGGWILGAVLVAGYGLYQYVSGEGLIVTAEGVARIRSVYGSPNNLGLYLGRALPVALALLTIVAVAIWRRKQAGPRSLAAGVFLVLTLAIIGSALLLSFSRGALVLGVPAALAVLLVAWQGRRGLYILAGLAVLALLAVPLLLQIPRFAGMFDLQNGTGFFRVNLWISAWRMFVDHPWLGVGPDNFLYAYRSYYILPAAWEEPNLSHPHNILMDFISRLGAPGLLVGVALIAGFWRAAWLQALARRSRRDGLGFALTVGMMGAVADMLGHGLVDHSFFLVDLAGVFMLCAALVQIVDVRAPTDPGESQAPH